MSYIQHPLVNALAFSGGRGSSAIAWMILRGDLFIPNLVVLNADPGMEDTRTLAYVDDMERRFVAKGIPFLRARRDLYREMLELKASGRKRFDLPPLWTKNRETGKKGRLMQGCTQAYKIAPMDRAMRVYMEEEFGLSRKSRRLGVGTVCKIIGFSNDEWMRIKEAPQKYVQFRYPLIEKKMGEAELTGYFLRNNLPMPPRSVCSGCYANGIAHFREMFLTRPENWEQAVAFDNEVRDLTCIGVRDECFVSSTLLPLEELANRNFVLSPKTEEQDAEMCHSGHCFV